MNLAADAHNSSIARAITIEPTIYRASMVGTSEFIRALEAHVVFPQYAKEIIQLLESQLKKNMTLDPTLSALLRKARLTVNPHKPRVH